MNLVYRVVWNCGFGTWQVVADTTRGHGKSKTPRVAMLALAAAMAVGSVALAADLPSGGAVVGGAGSISQSGGVMTVQQGSPRLAIDWQSFSIGPGRSVNFSQPSSSAVALNRVLGGDVSSIQGALHANGQVFLINPNGVLFSPTAQVNVGSLVASTLNLGIADFMSGNYKLDGVNGNAIVNLGHITAANGGTIALIAARVINEGTLVAPAGNVLLSAGIKVTLDLGGPVRLQVDEGALDALIQNGGAIRADGGLVYLSAKAAGELASAVVNNTGLIQAQNLENRSGSIYLQGDMRSGTVNVGGLLDASAPFGGDGGFIETSAAKVKVAGDARVTTLAPHGKTGQWLIDPQDYTVAASGGDVTGAQLSANLGSTDITIVSSGGAAPGAGNVNVNDPVTWSADTRLTLTAANDVNVNASITATGANAGVALNPNTANGADPASGAGVFNLAAGAAINLPNVSPRSTTAFVLNGMPYTVINSLGVEGSTTGVDLQGIGGNLSGHYALGTNIDASATSGWNVNAGFDPIGVPGSSFYGSFSGLGHVIGNLTINRPQTDDVGLFGRLGAGSVVNVGLVNAKITGGTNVGGLAGISSAEISNTYVDGEIVGRTHAGGLIGRNEGGAVSYSYAKGNVSAKDGYAGGLMGSNFDGSISKSYASNIVSSSSSNAGGLTSWNYQGTIKDSYATGAVTGLDTVGGFVGINVGLIERSYATGSTSATDTNFGYAGGFASLNSTAFGSVGTIRDSYATGSVSSTHQAGGLVDRNAAIIENSYSTGIVSAKRIVGGLVAQSQFDAKVINSFWDVTTSRSTSSAGGVGMSTVEMQKMANYVGAETANGNQNPNWRFTNTWIIYEGRTYPLLRSFMAPLTVTATPATKTYDGQVYSNNNGITCGGGACPSAHLFNTAGFVDAATSIGVKNAGTHTIRSDAYSDQQGYILTFTNGSLVVNPLFLTGSIGAASSTYGSALTPGTVTFDNRMGTDQVSAMANVNTSGLSTSGHPIAGSYTQSSGTALTGSDAGNYTFAGVTTPAANYTVQPLPLTAAIAAGTTTYGSALTPGAVTFINRVGSDLVNAAASATVNTGALSSSAHAIAGSYMQSVGAALAGADAGNYTFAGLTTPTANYTISPRSISVIGETAANKVYDGNLVAAINVGSAALAGAMGADQVSVVTSSVTGSFTDKNAGAAKLVTVAGNALSGTDAANYALTQPTGLTADIVPATLTVAANSLYKVFGDRDPAFSYAVGSVVPGDSLDGLLSGSLSRGQGELTGSHPIQQGSLASTSPNYALGYTSGTLMIVPRVQPAPVSRDEPIVATMAGYSLPYARLGLESITFATHRTDQDDLDKPIRQTGNDRLPGLPNLTIIDGGVRMPAGVREH